MNQKRIYDGKILSLVVQDHKWEIIERIEPDQDTVSLFDVEQSLIKILRKWSDPNELAPIGDKWKKGTLLLQPADKALKPKDVPIEVFFHNLLR